jgi:hypothetical protein
MGVRRASFELRDDVERIGLLVGRPADCVGSRGILRLTTDFGESSAGYDWLSVTRELARSAVTGDRYVVLKVAYDRHPGYGRSLAWIAPELRDVGLIMIEDHKDEPSPSRTWAGIVDGATFERFADAWGLDGMPHDRILDPVTGAGDLAMRAYTFDGMNWEIAGESPIVCVSVLVGVVGDRDGREADDLLRARARG